MAAKLPYQERLLNTQALKDLPLHRPRNYHQFLDDGKYDEMKLADLLRRAVRFSPLGCVYAQSPDILTLIVDLSLETPRGILGLEILYLCDHLTSSSLDVTAEKLHALLRKCELFTFATDVYYSCAVEQPHRLELFVGCAKKVCELRLKEQRVSIPQLHDGIEWYQDSFSRSLLGATEVFLELDSYAEFCGNHRTNLIMYTYCMIYKFMEEDEFDDIFNQYVVWAGSTDVDKKTLQNVVECVIAVFKILDEANFQYNDFIQRSKHYLNCLRKGVLRTECKGIADVFNQLKAVKALELEVKVDIH